MEQVDGGDLAATMATMAARPRYWGVEFAPVARPVLCDGREVVCLFKILSDADEEALTRYMMSVALEAPDAPPAPAGLEAFWQAKLAQDAERLRAQAEARALIAFCLLRIGEQPFDMPVPDKIAEVETWPSRLIREVVDTYAIVAGTPVRGLEALRDDAGFGNARADTGASFARAAFPVS